MPRTIPSALQTHLEGTTLTVALLVLLVRTDGVRFAFTGADSDIAYGGDTYAASTGVGITAIESAVGSGIDSADIHGFLASSVITDADLADGLYDGCRIEVRLCNRASVGDGVALLYAGWIGKIEVEDGSYRVELESLASRLRRRTGARTTATCRCLRLGDAQCKVNLAGNTVGGTAIRATKAVTSAPDRRNLRFTDSAPTGHYSNGIVKMTSGPNAGMERRVKAHVKSGSTAEIELRRAFPRTVSIGETALLEAGCDRVFATCDGKFANANNFHGEHQLPGNDKVGTMGRPPG